MVVIDDWFVLLDAFFASASVSSQRFKIIFAKMARNANNKPDEWNSFPHSCAVNQGDYTNTEIKFLCEESWHLNRDVQHETIAYRLAREQSHNEWKGMEDNIKNVSGNMDIKTVQKTCLLGTARILRKVLSIWNLFFETLGVLITPGQTSNQYELRILGNFSFYIPIHTIATSLVKVVTIG